MRMTTVVSRTDLLKQNWPFVLAILVSTLRFFPFLQSFPLVRVLTATFGMQVIWIFASAVVGMRIFRRKVGLRGTGYVLALTSVVLFAGAAGMLHFEGGVVETEGIHTYLRALWWTAMQLTQHGQRLCNKDHRWTGYLPWDISLRGRDIWLYYRPFSIFFN